MTHPGSAGVIRIAVTADQQDLSNASFCFVGLYEALAEFGLPERLLTTTHLLLFDRTPKPLDEDSSRRDCRRHRQDLLAIERLQASHNVRNQRVARASRRGTS